MNVFLDSIGCRLNQSEIEMIADQFRSAGHRIVGSVSDADLVVINSCAVTQAAESDSRQRVRSVGRGGTAKIVVTGCWATLDAKEVFEMSGVKWVVPNQMKDSLTAEVLNLPVSFFEQKHKGRQLLPGIHRRTRAMIKIQDGCDNYCTFCLTRLARGPSRSRPEDDIIEDIRAAVMGGAKEIVLTGVQSGSWGKDMPSQKRLFDLVAAILENCEVQRLRFSSLEPWEIDERFLSLWEDKRLCRHLHLPLQSGSPSVIKKMGRKITAEEFAQLIKMIRTIVPEMALTTDIMVGFPGENENEFDQSKDFVSRMSFAGGHVFTYSAREGTPAAHFIDQVPNSIRKVRNAQMRAILAESALNYRRRFLGQVLGVLWESQVELGSQNVSLSGLTDNYIRVNAVANIALWNQISNVRIIEMVEGGMRGEVIKLDIM